MKFAKIFDTKDGGQVLIEKDWEDDGDGAVDVILVSSKLADIKVSVTIRFGSEEKRDSAFNTFSQEQAEGARVNFNQMVNE